MTGATGMTDGAGEAKPYSGRMGCGAQTEARADEAEHDHGIEQERHSDDDDAVG